MFWNSKGLLGLSDETKACLLNNTLYCLMLERPLPRRSCAVNRPKRGFYCITDSGESDFGAVRQYLAQWWGKIIINNICLTLLRLVKKHLRFAFLSRWDSRGWKMLYMTPTASLSSMLIKTKCGRLQIELRAKCRSALASWIFYATAGLLISKHLTICYITQSLWYQLLSVTIVSHRQTIMSLWSWNGIICAAWD